MAARQRRSDRKEGRLKQFGETAHRAFVEFLRFPTLIIVGFLLLAAGTSALDFARIGWLEPIRTAIREILFRDVQATGDLLATIAGSIITVTSITFSLLLLAVQQAAGALTHVVYDQFLRRRVNQVYFGFFVGLALYTLVILATVNRPYNPVFGASLALLLTIVALMLMILLLYTTVNQMRPVVVIETIHDHVLAARECQRELLLRTRRTTHQSAAISATPVRATVHGYVVGVDLEAMAAAARKTRGEVEIVLHVSIGHYVAFQDKLASIGAASSQDAADIANAVREAVALEQQRDLDCDPAYGIEQLGIIGWTSVSTAKSNPSPGAQVLHSMRDLLARWSAERSEEKTGTSGEIVPVVYTDDVFRKLLDTFELLAVVASESMQPQTMTEFVRTFALMFARLPVDHKQRAEDLIRRSLSALGEHVLTGELSLALSDLTRALDNAGRRDTAAEIRTAHEALGASIGKLGSRATRVSTGA